MEALDRIMQQVRQNGTAMNHQSQNQPAQTTQDLSKEECPICHGAGWIITPSANSQPTMKRCKCYELAEARRMWERAGINAEQTDLTFSNYKVWNKTSEEAKNTAIQYFKSFEQIKSSRHNSIAFIGQVGSGKTHLSVALAINFLKKGIAVVYMPYRDVVTKLKQNILDEEYYRKVVGKYQTAEILLVDDLFKGRITSTDINIMFEIINYRYLNNLPAIVSSEFTADKLLDFDEAIGSRILQMCRSFTVQIQGKENNYRLRG